jgi:hypothetical protein
MLDIKDLRFLPLADIGASDVSVELLANCAERDYLGRDY